MWIHRPLILAALAVVSCGFASAAPCSVSDIAVVGSLYTNNGCFNMDDNEQRFNFTLSSFTYQFTAFTWQWALPFGNGVGGFASNLALYDAGTNALIAYDNTGGDPSLGTCGYRGNDPTQYGSCLDSRIDAIPLAAGNYFLVLTEWNNYAPDVYDPTQFSQYGTGNFTSDDNHWALGNNSAFLSPIDSQQRGSNWGITISDSPEPVTGLLGLSGILITWAVSRRRRTDRS